jgi:hypothetical protein
LEVLKCFIRARQFGQGLPQQGVGLALQTDLRETFGPGAASAFSLFLTNDKNGHKPSDWLPGSVPEGSVPHVSNSRWRGPSTEKDFLHLPVGSRQKINSRMIRPDVRSNAPNPIVLPLLKISENLC